MVLVIALMIDGVFCPQVAFDAPDCEHIIQQEVVKKSWQDVFGKDVILVCTPKKGESMK